MKKFALILLLAPTLSFAGSDPYDTTGYSARMKAAMLSACPNVTFLEVTVFEADRGVGVPLDDTRRAGYNLAIEPLSERECADAAALSFDWRLSTQNAWDVEHTRLDAKSVLDNSGTAGTKLLRASVLVLLDEINTLRAAQPIPVASITRSGTTGTVTTRYPHGLTGTPTLLVSGADVAAYNGQATMTVTGETTLIYTVASGQTPAAGSIMLFTSAALAPRTKAQAVNAIGSKLTAGGGDK